MAERIEDEKQSKDHKSPRYHLIASPEVAPGLPIAELKNAKIAVTRDNKGVGEALVALLTNDGYQTELVNEVTSEYNYIICLDGLNDIETVDDAISINKNMFKHAQTIATSIKDKKVFLAVLDIGGYFGIKNYFEKDCDRKRAWLGGIAGLVKTAAKEWPDVTCKAIDLAVANLLPAELANKIYQEMREGGKDLEIGLPLAGERISPQLISNSVQAQSTVNLSNNMRLLVTGGGYGITAKCMIELAKKITLRIAICGRTVLPAANEQDHFSHLNNRAEIKNLLIANNKASANKKTPKQLNEQLNKIFVLREIKETISTLQKLGSEVIYLPLDIQNQDQLQEGSAQMRDRWGGIDGLIHGAGVLADKLIIDKTAAQFDRVFTTKVVGLQNLLNVTANDSLKLICLFSSVAARHGNAGQSDYAMANEILNKVAQAEYVKRGDTCLVKSINWGPWESGMVDASLKQMFADRGIRLLSQEEGSACFVDELLYGNPKQVEVLLG